MFPMKSTAKMGSVKKVGPVKMFLVKGKIEKYSTDCKRYFLLKVVIRPGINVVIDQNEGQLYF